MQTLALADGRLVALGDRTAGGSKNDTRHGRLGQQRVVVKVQHAHGRLRDEERALRFLAGHAVRVPTVVASGSTPDGEPFLVITREEGVRTNSADGWERLGRDLATLVRIPISRCPLPRVTAAEFAADHRIRLQGVAALLDRDLVRPIATAIDRVETVERLVVTHGDPGSGNYLDIRPVAGTGTGSETAPGILIDWETASVSPLGLDLGRAAFIGLLDLGRSGVGPGLSEAVVRGYLGSLGSLHDPGTIDDELLAAWVTVAGLQFVHGRFTQPLRADRTPQMAADALAQHLS